MNTRKMTIGLSGKWGMFAVAIALIAALPTNAVTWNAQREGEDFAHREDQSQPGPLAGPESGLDEEPPPDVDDDHNRADHREDGPHRQRRGELRRRDEVHQRGVHRGGEEELLHRSPLAPSDRDKPFRRGDDRRAPREFTPGEIDRAMRILRMELPEWYGRLAEMREFAPDRFHRAVRKFLPMTREYVSMRETDPRLASTIIEEFKIEGELRELSRRYHDPSTHPAEREEMDERIDRLVHEQFEMRMRRREARMHKLELRLRQQMERLEREQKRFQEDQERVEDLIARRIDEIKRGALREPAFQSRDHRRGRPPESKGEKHRGQRRSRGRR